MQKAVVVLPTYNERENIISVLTQIVNQRYKLPSVDLHVLVVDDSSPDGTGQLVQEFMSFHPGIHLLSGKKQGLGAAYIRGFECAKDQLGADIVMEMDADLSHNPDDIPRLITEVLKDSDFVIGSRYIEGGSIPANWSILRKINSKGGNIFARFVAGLYKVHDCTGGFRAIKVETLRKIDLKKLEVKGYAFQINLLYHMVRAGAKIHEVPIQFVDREKGQSKIRLKDITEFVASAFRLRMISTKPYFYAFVGALGIFSLLFLFGTYAAVSNFTFKDILADWMLAISVLLFIQGAFTLSWMLYAWDDPERIDENKRSFSMNKSPNSFAEPKYSFTALIPARHEEAVIADTIKAVANIDYPEYLKEALVICRRDDPKTIYKASECIRVLGSNNTRMVIFNDYPINKPHGLNIGLKESGKDIVVVFDAEDEPHKDIYNIVNTVLIKDNPDVVQSGVQLINFQSSWFSALNVLEYFFWFKSALHLFSNLGVIPLGGNTVFFKRNWLNYIGGWDEHCLTEDADIGIRLSTMGAKIKIIYDERYTTREETPPDITSFIKQRTRWNQGFIQVFFKGDWLRQKNILQQILSVYILIWPQIQALMFLYIPFSVLATFLLKLPVLETMIVYLPFILLILQMITLNIGLYEFTRDYDLPYPILSPFKILLTFYPYQFLLGLSALRSVLRSLKGQGGWEKTAHTNAHRIENQAPAAVTPAMSPSWASPDLIGAN